MFSLDYELSVPGYSSSVIGYATLVRTKPADMQIKLTNDGQYPLYKLNVKLVVESYVGQDKALLFWQPPVQIIEQIEPKTTIQLTFRLRTNYPGLVAVASYVTDNNNNAIMTKRQNGQSYAMLPVRWWFHVVDNISVETLSILKALVAQSKKGTEKPKVKKLKRANK